MSAGTGSVRLDPEVWMMVTKEFVLTQESLRHASWLPLFGADGVRHAVLWRAPTERSHAGLMRLDPGATVPTHLHEAGEHHIFVVHGMCFVDGEALGPESYAHVDPGERHGIDHAGPQGCTIFYLYLTRSA